MIILITLVIQYGNSHLNLKSEDLRSNAFVETKTFVHISNISAVTDPILNKLSGPNSL